MKNMKEKIHKLITVILCFLVSMVPKRDEVDASVIGQAVTASPVNGNAAGAATVSAENMDKDVNMWIVHNRKHHRMWKKLFFWLQGPGDRKTKTVSLLYRNKKQFLEVLKSFSVVY